jgi:hypothetical protein
MRLDVALRFDLSREGRARVIRRPWNSSSGRARPEGDLSHPARASQQGSR